MHSTAPSARASGLDFDQSTFKKCPACDWTAVAPSAIDSHMKREHPGHLVKYLPQKQQYYGATQGFDGWICTAFDCGFKTESKMDLHNHKMNIHGNPVPTSPALICNTFKSDMPCGYVAANGEDLDRHQMSVHGKMRISPPRILQARKHKRQRTSIVGSRKETLEQHFNQGWPISNSFVNFFLN